MSSSETSINFGPQWLRTSVQQENNNNNNSHVGSSSVSSSSKMASKLASMKLAEHRYGREEMLAICESIDLDSETELNELSNASAFTSFPFLWRHESQVPVNLSVVGEEEARAWQRGANSETSLRIYNSSNSVNASTHLAMSNNNSHLGRGAFRGRGRGVGRGYDRGGFTPGFVNSNGWYNRSTASNTNNNSMEETLSVRKGNTRAPMDDWRKSNAQTKDEDQGGWRSNNGSTTNARRWTNTPASTNSWRSDNAMGRGRGLMDRGGWGGSRGASSRGRGGAQHQQRLPEWAKDDDDWANDNDVNIDEQDDDVDQFDEEGNFHKAGSLKESKRVAKSSIIDDDEEEEEIDPDDVQANEGGDGESLSNELPDKDVKREAEADLKEKEPKVAEIPETIEQQHNSEQEHLDAGHLVSKLVDDEEYEETSPSVNKENNFIDDRRLLDERAKASVDEAVAQIATATNQDEQPSRWLYMDPQGNVQGPFEGENMLEWLTAGFFPADLRLRRTTDAMFIPLNEMTKLYGRIPFLPGGHPGYSRSPPPIMPNPMALEEEQQMMVLKQKMYLLRQQQQIEEERKQRESQLMQLAAHQQVGNRPAFPPLGGLFPQLQQPPQTNLLNQHALHPNATSSLFPTMVAPPSENPLKALLERNIGVVNKDNSDARSRLDFPDFAASSVGRVTNSATTGHYTHQSQPANINESYDTGIRTPAPTESSNQQQAFDPIKSLLSQLDSSSRAALTQQEDVLQHHQRESPVQAQQRPLSRPSSAEQGEGQLQQQQEHASKPTSIWDTPEPQIKPIMAKDSIWSTSGDAMASREVSESLWNERAEERESEPVEAKPTEQVQEMEEEKEDLTINDSEFIHDEKVVVSEGFVRPKTSEKREKKSKKAEERKRQKEAKQMVEQAREEATKYIPGISTERPKTITEDQALAMLKQQAEQNRVQEMAKDEQQRVPSKVSRPAPWAKKNENDEGGDAKTPSTLSEIQRFEMERVRREEREKEALQRKLEEERLLHQQQQQQQRASWAHSISGQTKSLAEIQAEEEMMERKRLEKEKKEQETKQQELKRMPEHTSVWAAAKSNISWASKAGKNAPPPSAPAVIVTVQQAATKRAPAPPQAKPKGLWDEPSSVRSVPGLKDQSSSKKTSKSSGKKIKEDERVASLFKEKRPAGNEFETWCQSALEELQAQVDIPTFLAFLKDIDSPYEVHDYIKSYVGEGRGAKNFAKEYVERRSKYRNALKSSQRRHEDDLLKPAAAINPKEDLPLSSHQSNIAPPSAGQKGKKAKNKKNTKGNDASHLLGFSVTASTNRVNVGEIDTPNM